MGNATVIIKGHPVRRHDCVAATLVAVVFVFGIGRAVADGTGDPKSVKDEGGKYSDDARTKLRAMRDELIRKFKESGIPADRELEHAKIVGPSIAAIKTAFEDFI